MAILVGAVTGAGINVYNQLVYNRKSGGKTAPELRLPPMMFGSFLFSAGEFPRPMLTPNNVVDME